MELMMSIIPFIVIAAVIILVAILAAQSYHVAATDEVLVVTGPGKRSFVTGRSVFIIPFIYHIDRLSLGTITADLKSEKPIPTRDAILIDVSATANFQIGIGKNEKGDDLLEIASRNYLNQDKETMLADVQQVLLGKMREVIGGTDLKDLLSKREEFSGSVFSQSRQDMEALGLELVTFNVRDFTDGQHVIESMGASMAAEIQRDAKTANIDADQKVAERQNQLDLKNAELKSTADSARAKADMVYQITQAEQSKNLKIAEQEAEIAATEKQAEVATKQAEVKEAELNASVRKQADADRYSAQQKAEADLYTAQKNAEAMKASASGEAEAISAKGEAEAKIIASKGKSEAEATKAAGEAYNVMDNPMLIAQKLVETLPAILHEIATPLSKVDAITMYGDGNTSKLVGDVTNSVSQVVEGMKASTGIDLPGLLNSAVGGTATGSAVGHALKGTSDAGEKKHDGTETDREDDSAK